MFEAKYKQDFMSLEIEKEIDLFWRWFYDYQNEIEIMAKKNNKQFLKEINMHLKKIFPNYKKDIFFSIRITKPKKVLEINYGRSSYILSLATELFSAVPNYIKKYWEFKLVK